MKVTTLHAPGRVNIIGEHTDYNGGLVLPCAIHMGLKIQIQTGEAQSPFVVVVSGNRKELIAFSEIQDCAEKLRTSLSGIVNVSSHSNKYVLGCLAYYALEHGSICSLEIRIESNLPSGAGMSSSAALCCGLLAALHEHFGKKFDPVSLAKTSMFVEHRFAGTQCGLMDQLAVLLGKKNHFVEVDFSQDPPPVHLHDAQSIEEFYDILVFHTGKTHSLADSEYNLRRQSCENGVLLLNQAFKSSEVTLEHLRKKYFTHAKSQEELKRMLRESIPSVSVTEVNRLSHGMYESVRVTKFIKALKVNDWRGMDDVLLQSHKSLRDDYQVSCTELDVAVDTVRSAACEIDAPRSEHPPILGGRMTGGGFGGCTIQFVKKTVSHQILERFSQSDNSYTKKTGLRPRLFLVNPSHGICSSSDGLKG